MPKELPDWMSDAWNVRRAGRVTAWVREDFREAFERLGLMEAADRGPSELAPGARAERLHGGRGELGFVPAGRLGEAVVRPYRRGGLPARLLDRRYFLGSRAFHEAALTENLRRRGVPVPEPLAAVRSEQDWGYRAALVTLRVRGASPAPALLEGRDPEACRPLLGRMGESVGRMHGEGGLHPDLNAHNFLLKDRSREPAVLVDFDRGRIVGGSAPGFYVWLSLRRLRRSLDKLGLEAALEAFDAFEEAHDRALEEAEAERQEDAGS